MKLACCFVCLSVAFFLLSAVVSGDEFGPEIIQQIRARTKNMTQAVDWRYCVPHPRKQIGPSCHTSAFSLQFMSALCLSDKPSPSKAHPTELSLTDFWSCKTKWGFQHGIEVVNWWNQNGAFSTAQDQKWDDKLAEACYDAWEKGRGGRNQAGDFRCDCRRFNNTHNPLGYLNPKDAVVGTGVLDSRKAMAHCGAPKDDNEDSWINEIMLAKLVEHYGPVIVMSRVMSFGTGNPNKPTHVCVREHHGWGHNYVVVGYNLTDNPHTAYWILSNSLKATADGYGYGRMFLKCGDGYWPGAWGIGKVKASRYCLKDDKRGICGGGASCTPGNAFEDMIPAYSATFSDPSEEMLELGDDHPLSIQL